MYTCVPIWAFLPGKCLSLSSRLWTVPYYSVLSDSLWPHGLQLTRLPYTSPSPKACWNSYPLSWWYHPTISSSVIPFSSSLWSCPAFQSFLMSQLFTSGVQNIGASASTSVLQMNIQEWFPLGLTGLIPLQSKGLSRVFCKPTVQKLSLWCSAFFIVQLSHPHLTTGKIIALNTWTFSEVMFCFLICCLGLSWLIFQEASFF